ncbi:MT-A70-domain-containing protein [Pyrenochaeta sp. MPI-SDFR-AT-0127]|nr:MT-A70-domain-containing protein [Pyrenochaeta sp. MPI-SDFR-AT-0127]
MAFSTRTYAQSSTRSSIIFRNPEHDITLLDIPTSIAVAQGRQDTLFSTLPLDVPIEIKEDHRPTSQKAKAKKGHEASDFVHHAEYSILIGEALARIRANVSGPWCAPRKLSTQQHSTENMAMDHLEKELESRLREWAAWSESKGDDTAYDLQEMMASLGATSEYDATAPADTVPQKWMVSYQAARQSSNSTKVAETVTEEDSTEPWTSTFHNPDTLPTELVISQNTSSHGLLGQEYRFTVPPRSTLFLSDSTHSNAFRTSFRQLTNDFSLPRHFDLVLLDPPWPNRSAKRKGAYEQVGGVPYMKRMLLRMDIDNYFEHGALVGIWITNKPSLREHVLGPGGLFEKWNVGLIEEWIWIKTTAKGEPMFTLDASMRKPYEILLLGRAAPNSWTAMTHAPSIRRRVIAAVPDIHSRKPCLKELLEPYMPDPVDYTALEIFSRYLVSGWTSWGNEVLKFNWHHYWTSSALPSSPSHQELTIRTV